MLRTEDWGDTGGTTVPGPLFIFPPLGHDWDNGGRRDVHGSHGWRPSRGGCGTK